MPTRGFGFDKKVDGQGLEQVARDLGRAADPSRRHFRAPSSSDDKVPPASPPQPELVAVETDIKR